MELPAVLGYDVSGVVEETGIGVETFRSGDKVHCTAEVKGNRSGSCAEYQVVAETIVARKPSTLGHTDAAAIPLAGGTAWEGIVRRLAVRPGESVLVNGAAGGVGSFAVQFAKAAGARVLATAGTFNQETLRSLGADRAIDYGRDDVAGILSEETGGRGLDAIFDTVGRIPLSKLLPSLRDSGRVATILAPEGDLRPIYMKTEPPRHLPDL